MQKIFTDRPIKIVHNIPSYTTSNTEFDTHWDVYAAEKLPSIKLQKAEEFINLLNLKNKLQTHQFNNIKLLDAGCGDGVHLKVLHDKFDLASNSVIGLDISLGSLLKVRNRSKLSNELVHADIQNMPFADNSFDIIISFGVIAYAHAPAQSIKELLRTLKPGGHLLFWVYEKPKGMLSILLTFSRRVFSVVPNWVQTRLADLLVPVLGILPTKSGLSLWNSSWKECREVILVNLAPTTMSFPTKKEVEEWVQEASGIIVQDFSDQPITMIVTKG